MCRVPMTRVPMTTWVSTLIAIAGVSLVSLSGAAMLVVGQDFLRRALFLIISFSVGALLGDAILHVLPELAEGGGLTVGISFVILGGVGGFFVLEKILHWHHAHIASEDVLHPVAVTNLLGDAIHNFVDGAIIAGAFLASVPVGITTTLAVALHEIPQEIGDLAILIHAGMRPRRALAWNVLSALAAILGGILTLALSAAVEGVARPLLAITAGGFIYIASADLIPELHRETRLSHSVAQLTGILAGVGMMGLLLFLE
jgi:zinc and cadmium transporter